MNLRSILILLGFVIAAVLIFLNLDRLLQFFSLIQAVNWLLLFLIIPVQFISYFGNAKFYQSLLRVFGFQVPLRLLFEASLAITFVNQAFPSGGVSSASYLMHVLKGRVPAGKSTLIQVMRHGFTYAAMLLVLILGFFLLFWGGGVGKISVRFALLVQLFIIMAGIVALVIFASSKSRVEPLAIRLARFINRLGAWFRYPSVVSQVQIHRFLDEFYQGFGVMVRKRGGLQVPLAYTLLTSAAEITTFYVVMASFGLYVNPGVAIAAYTLANLFSLISPITNGVGVYEATMIAALAALGVPFQASVSIVLVYRVLSFILLLPIGLYFYRKSLA